MAVHMSMLRTAIIDEVNKMKTSFPPLTSHYVPGREFRYLIGGGREYVKDMLTRKWGIVPYTHRPFEPSVSFRTRYGVVTNGNTYQVYKQRNP